MTPPTADAETEGSRRGGHTPGPWFWALDRQNQPTSLMQSGPGNYVICPQADISDYGLSVNPWNDVSEADARLIAAAPELLDAAVELDRLLLVIESAVRFADPTHSKAVLAALKANSAAISKAKGGAA